MCAIWQETTKQLPRFLSYFQHIFYNYLDKNLKTTNALTFLTDIISAIGGVNLQNRSRILLVGSR